MKPIRCLGSLAENFGIWPFVLVAVIALIAYVGVIFGALTARQHPRGDVTLYVSGPLTSSP